MAPTVTKPAPAPRLIRDKAFATRLARACDGNGTIPEYNKGRLTWVVAALQERFNEKVSVETVRKWFAGEVKPRPDKIALLAQLLEVDQGWLALGIEPDLEPRARKVRNAIAEGAVNVLAGFIQMGGGHPAFPEPGDARAEANHIDLYSIIKGAQYAFHVVLAKEEGDSYRFSVPKEHTSTFVVGVVPTDGPGVKFYELPADWIAETGTRKGSSVEVVVEKKAEGKLRRIRSFEDRL